MQFTGQLVYLGYIERVSKKTDKTYILVRFEDEGTGDIHEFYAGELGLMNAVAMLKKYKETSAVFEMKKAYKGNGVEISLIDVKQG